MRNLFIVDIEPLDNRYTKQWFTYIPEWLRTELGTTFNIITISGVATSYTKPQKGAFFDFAATCEYKATQASAIAQMFANGLVKENDIFFFTDAWNHTVHTVRYISELNKIPVKCAGIWHAGWYDPTDILGFSIQNKPWVRSMEESMFHAFDANFFGTQHNLDVFLNTHQILIPYDHKCFVGGAYPLEFIRDLKNDTKKQDMVVFPHRLNEDKAPWIFNAIRDTVLKTRSDITFVKTQDLNLSKEEYYALLSKCKVVFSANKHENLGIGTFESMFSGCVPLVPRKLSYKEMYEEPFLYDVASDFYENPPLEILASKIVEFVDNYDSYSKLREEQADKILQTFFSGWHILKTFRNI